MPRTADRTITTCQNCRLAKTKCDKARPQCTRCLKQGSPCIYEDQLVQPPAPLKWISEMPGQTTRHNLSSRSIPSRAQSMEQSSMVTISANDLRNIEQRVATLDQMVQTLQAEKSDAIAPVNEQVGTELLSTSPKDLEPLTRQAGYLSLQDGERVRYVDSSFWASITYEVSELDDLLRNQTQQTLESLPDERDSVEDEFAPIYTTKQNEEQLNTSDFTGQGSDNAMLGAFAEQPLSAHYARPPTRRMRRETDFFRDFPLKQTCDILLEAYFKGYHPIVPLVHLPSFRVRYHDFWTTLNTPHPPPAASLTFATLVLAFAYGGTVASPDILGNDGDSQATAEEKTESLHRLLVRALRLASFPRAPTLDTLRAYLICQMSCLRLEEPLTCVAFIGLASRVATMLGLHVDPSHLSGISPIEAAERRLVWWTMVYVDTEVAIASGLPPVVGLSSWNVREVSELKEEYIGTPSGTQYEDDVRQGSRQPDSADDPRSKAAISMVSTSGIFVAGKFQGCLAVRRIVMRTLQDKPLTTDEIVLLRKDITRYVDDLRLRISRIPEPEPSKITESDPGSSYDLNPAFNRWTRLLLSATIDGIYCFICHPLLKSSIIRMWETLYAQCIEQSQAYLGKAAQLACIKDFGQYQWSWPGNHQPLHALMVILLDLIENPASPAAPRSCDIVDSIFALSGPYGGLVAGTAAPETIRDRPLTEGGTHTWEYFRRLRVKAWQKVGLDSSVCQWTREQAVQHYSNAVEPEVAPADRLWRHIYDNLESESRPPGGDDVYMSPPGISLSPPFIDWDYLDAVLEGRTDDVHVEPGGHQERDPAER